MAATGVQEPQSADVLIVGGGHAGLSAALTLYRALYTCIILDIGRPRNAYSTAVRLTPTWEGQSPDQMKEASREELAKTGLITFIDTEVQVIGQEKDGMFKATDEQGREWLGSKVLLATGTRDLYPDIPGYEALYASGIYPCMFQFGYEMRGSPSAGLLAVDGLANVMQASILANDGHRFSDVLTLYTNGNNILAEQLSSSLGPRMLVDTRKIASLERGEGSSVQIHFDDGTAKTESFLVHRPLTALDRRFVDQLGINLAQMGDMAVGPPFYSTNISGVYAAGDCATPMKTVSNAIVTGAYAGCGLARELSRSTSIA